MKRLLITMGVISILMTGCDIFGPSIPEIASTADLSSCTTAGTAEQSADPDVEALRQAMLNFRASLSEKLLVQAQNCLDSERFAYWHNTPPPLFGGLNHT